MQLQENVVVADRFRLIRMIGRGGMGSVWQAMHLALDQPCAVKFIEGELANVAEAHARFEREAKAAAQLRSPHVVQIIDHGVWQGTPYIAMELLDGEDLGKALAKAGGRLPPAQVSAIIQQVCRALTKAHSAGVVHRDLKPDNVFLVNDDDRELVKILDFGVAKQTAQVLDGSNTKTGAMLGTPYYMSPEQAQGIKSVDFRSDLWSLAVIVYQCITGRLPFDSEALGDLLVKIIVQPVPVPSQVANVPPGFDKWWAKAADRDPDGRFQSAKEFASSLAVALGTSAMTDVGMMRPSQPFQGTAMMSNAPLNTPNPNVPSALGSVPTGGVTATTPHPGHPTPPGMVMGAQMSEPQGFGSTGNPATFSGVEPPVTIPKKGPPIGVIAGIAALVLVGVVSAGVVVVRRSSASSDVRTASSSVPVAVATESATLASAQPTATLASAQPTATTAPVESAEPVAPTTATTPIAPAPRPTVAVSPVRTGGGTRPPSTSTTASKPTASAAATASAKKWVPGF